MIFETRARIHKWAKIACIVYIVHNLQISMYFYNMYYSFHLQIHLDEYFLERIQNKKLSNIKDNILQIGFIY